MQQTIRDFVWQKCCCSSNRGLDSCWSPTANTCDLTVSLHTDYTDKSSRLNLQAVLGEQSEHSLHWQLGFGNLSLVKSSLYNIDFMYWCRSTDTLKWDMWLCRSCLGSWESILSGSIYNTYTSLRELICLPFNQSFVQFQVEISRTSGS